MLLFADKYGETMTMGGVKSKEVITGRSEKYANT